MTEKGTTEIAETVEINEMGEVIEIALRADQA